MKAPRWLVRSMLFPFHERLRGRSTPKILRTFRNNDLLSRDAMEHLHQRLLLGHLQRAAELVPFYKKALVSGPITSQKDLGRFPLIDKALVREASDELKAPGSSNLIKLETGGSSGEPLRFFSDPLRESSQLACKWRARAWFGLDPASRETALWGSPIETGRQSLVRRVTSDLLGYQLLSAFQLNDGTMAGFRKALGGGRADFVYGYASVLARYARFLRSRNETLSDLALKVAVTTAETLLPEDRRVISEAFGCPVANEYGCRDGGLIAHECPKGLLHVMHDAVHVEIVDGSGNPQPPGTSGEVVVTNLWARGFPMIRYRLGDRASLSESPCDCGLPHPVLKSLEGRMTDTVVRDDGTRVHGLALIYILRELKGVGRFRCIQRRIGEVEIEIVPGQGFDAGRIDVGVIARVHRVLGKNTQVRVKTVEDLSVLPSGKHRYIICEIPQA